MRGTVHLTLPKPPPWESKAPAFIQVPFYPLPLYPPWAERCVHAKLLQSCPTLRDSMDYSPPGSCVLGIPEARTLEWVAISFSRGSSQPTDGTHVSCIGRQILYCWPTSKVRIEGYKRTPKHTPLLSLDLLLILDKIHLSHLVFCVSDPFLFILVCYLQTKKVQVRNKNGLTEAIIQGDNNTRY